MPTKLKPLFTTPIFDLYTLDNSTSLELPYTGTINAGFPSPANDFSEDSIDLNKYLIKNPSTTFLMRAKGFSLKNIGIDDGDLLIIDKSIEPKNGLKTACVIDGEFTLKKLMVKSKELCLMPENEDFKPIKVTEYNNFKIWGTLTFSIKAHKH